MSTRKAIFDVAQLYQVLIQWQCQHIMRVYRKQSIVSYIDI